MGSRKEKISVLVSRGELPQVLEQLAAGISAGRLVVGEREVELGDFKSLELSLKPLGEELALKVKVKFPRPSEDVLDDDDEEEHLDEEGAEPEAGEGAAPEAGEDGRPRYRRLKKRMSKSWKAIRGALKGGALPDPELAAGFLADSRLMIEYPGKGDRYYPDYREAVGRLERALAGQDLEAATAAAVELHGLKKACHAMYK